MTTMTGARFAGTMIVISVPPENFTPRPQLRNSLLALSTQTPPFQLPTAMREA